MEKELGKSDKYYARYDKKRVFHDNLTLTLTFDLDLDMTYFPDKPASDFRTIPLLDLIPLGPFYEKRALEE